MMQRKILLGILLQSAIGCAWAAPPFLTDDAEPASYGVLQTYLFGSGLRSTHINVWNAPAVEFDLGVVNNLEFHTIVPMTYRSQQPGTASFGLSDTLIGLKWRFVTETDSRPEIAFVPNLMLPTGNAERSLGNGRTWTSMPIWVEKHFGAWTTYGGGGYVFNSAKNQSNFKFGGWLLQRDFSKQLTLGTEIYIQGSATKPHFAPNEDTGPVTLFNAGGTYNITPSQALVFSLGHSIAGSKQWIAYFGYNWNVELIKTKH